MTENEAIAHAREKAKEQRYYANFERNGMMYQSCIKCAEEHEQLVEWLEELKQYRAIGTPEECRTAVEKQTAKKVKSISQVKDGDSYVGLIGRCPCCGDILEEDTVYCDCGQRLDCGDEE